MVRIGADQHGHGGAIVSNKPIKEAFKEAVKRARWTETDVELLKEAIRNERTKKAS